MDVDALALQVLAGAVGQHLHVAREHEQLRTGLVEQRQQPLLLLGFAPFDDRQVMERQRVPVGEPAVRIVVRDDAGNLDRQVPMLHRCSRLLRQ